MLITLGPERVTVRVNVFAEMKKRPILEKKADNRGLDVFFLLNNCHHFVLPK